ncbi:hypothetical protein L2E82_44647 [Cichorium intybus]|uniref:Uncharacterized protein n=1 Tax=Cichorium intybus TaxID=13427 RepID=A0ACB8ZQW7_CICIN|nr:hypothetical protein L2E82_44647 [Cichorium intybus]
MATAGEGSSYSPEGVSIHVLKNQSANFFLFPDTKLYPKLIDALIECLKCSILNQALTATPSVPVTLVHRAHYICIATYKVDNTLEFVTYEVMNADNTTKRVQLKKSRFAKALR